MNQLKQKKCKFCKTLHSNTGPYCRYECALEQHKINEAKKERKKTAERKVELRSRRDWIKLAQAAFNKFIRERDKKDPCISCGRHHYGQYHAGHYLTTGAKPELRFDEANCHKQCAPCNNHLSGNLILYRLALIRKIGWRELNRLEGPQVARKWTIEELKEITSLYLKKTKELKKDLTSAVSVL